jgi:Predicted membrane protein
MNAWSLIGFGANVSVIVMALAWAVARRLKNASLIEPAWTYGFAIVACLYALIGSGTPFRKSLIAGMVLVSSTLLATSLLRGIIWHHPTESDRYALLREQFPKRPWLMFFGFSQYRAGLLWLLSIPFAIACSNTAPGINGWEVIALILWLAAITGVIVSKFQLARFRSDRGNSEKVCATGLWQYSRHPDDFAHWVIWIAYFLFALGSPWGWITFYCPLLVLHSMTKSTGIPASEARCLKSFRDEYRRYQIATSAFIPRPPKTGHGIKNRLREAGHPE